MRSSIAEIGHEGKPPSERRGTWPAYSAVRRYLEHEPRRPLGPPTREASHVPSRNVVSVAPVTSTTAARRVWDPERIGRAADGHHLLRKGIADASLDLAEHLAEEANSGDPVSEP